MHANLHDKYPKVCYNIDKGMCHCEISFFRKHTKLTNFPGQRDSLVFNEAERTGIRANLQDQAAAKYL